MSIYDERYVAARRAHLLEFIDKDLETHSTIDALVHTLVRRVRELYVNTIIPPGFIQGTGIEAVAMCPLSVINLTPERWAALQEGSDEQIIDGFKEVVGARIRVAYHHLEELDIRVDILVRGSKPRIVVSIPVESSNVTV